MMKVNFLFVSSSLIRTHHAMSFECFVLAEQDFEVMPAIDRTGDRRKKKLILQYWMDKFNLTRGFLSNESKDKIENRRFFSYLFFPFTMVFSPTNEFDFDLPISDAEHQKIASSCNFFCVFIKIYIYLW